MNLAITQTMTTTPATPALTDRDRALMDYIGACTARGAAADRTVAAYKYSIERFCTWCREAGLRPETARRADIEDWRGHMCAAGAAAATVMQRLAAVRTLYKALQRAGIRPDNPAEHVRAPRAEETPIERVVRKYVPPEAMVGVLAGCGADERGVRDRALLLVMYVLGLRVSEVQQLDWLDWGGDTLAFKAKGAQARILAVPEGVQAALAGLRVHGAGAGPIFCAGGARMSVRGIQKMVAVRLGHAGRAGLSPHALRHSCASASAASGATPYAIQDQMGHASLRTTSIYTRAAARFMEAPSLAVAKALGI